MAVDVAVRFVLLLLGGREGGDVGSSRSFDDGVEVEPDWRIAIHLLAEVGEVKGGLPVLTADAGHQLADLHLRLDGIDVDDIVGTGSVVTHIGTKNELYMEAVGMTAGDMHFGQRTLGDKQGGIVDMHFAVVIHEAVLVQTREKVGFGQPRGVSLLGEAVLEDDAEEGRGLLACLEEGQP